MIKDVEVKLEVVELFADLLAAVLVATLAVEVLDKASDVVSLLCIAVELLADNRIGQDGIIKLLSLGILVMMVVRMIMRVMMLVVVLMMSLMNMLALVVLIMLVGAISLTLPIGVLRVALRVISAIADINTLVSGLDGENRGSQSRYGAERSNSE